MELESCYKVETILNISIGQRVEEIQKSLAECQEVKYQFRKKTGPIEYQYQCMSNMSDEEVARYTRKLIKGTRFGNIIMFRVLIDGQFFDGGKVYNKEDKEYKATRSAR